MEVVEMEVVEIEKLRRRRGKKGLIFLWISVDAGGFGFWSIFEPAHPKTLNHPILISPGRISDASSSTVRIRSSSSLPRPAQPPISLYPLTVFLAKWWNKHVKENVWNLSRLSIHLRINALLYLFIFIYLRTVNKYSKIVFYD